MRRLRSGNRVLMTADLEKPIVAEAYSEFLQDLKARIRQAQVRAALSVNRGARSCKDNRRRGGVQR